MLYESYIHPVTILSTLPSAGVGALLALLVFHTELTVIALIGIVLLIGIVKKNAIMMIDFAVETERSGKSPEESIYQACLLRFRPIMMTTMAALFGGLPLALATGTGAELRCPLGISIVGGLMVSQMLTLYTTPVIYLYMDRLQQRLSRRKHAPAISGEVPPTAASSARPVAVLAQIFRGAGRPAGDFSPRNIGSTPKSPARTPAPQKNTGRNCVRPVFHFYWRSTIKL